MASLNWSAFFIFYLTTTGERFRFRVSATRFLMVYKKMERSQFAEKKIVERNVGGITSQNKQKYA